MCTATKEHTHVLLSDFNHNWNRVTRNNSITTVRENLLSSFMHINGDTDMAKPVSEILPTFLVNKPKISSTSQ